MTPRQDGPSEDADATASGGHQPRDIIAGKYLLRHVLGIGGMGTVWAATNLDLDLDVAIKVVNKGLCSDETRARLATEARAEAKLQHRGIVRVLDLGVTSAGEPFLVMERLQGRSLGDLLEEVGHLDSKDAVRLMLPIVEALAFVHDRGIVHRDLKPDNVFLAEQCGKIQPKLVDFGIAKLEDVPVNRRHTGRGAVVGSPGYMAPEHARGAEVDHRADIFCASLVLYEAISGRAAFRGANYNELLRAVIEQELDPITAFGRGDAELSRILERGLAKQPGKRQTSCHELGRELAAWLRGQGETEDVTGEPLATWLDFSTVGEAETGPVTPALALVRASRSRIPKPPASDLASLRGVSISTAGLRPPRSLGRRLAFVALAVSGFAGGFAATTALDLVPGHSQTPSQTAVAAVAPNVVRANAAITAHPNVPTVTPVDRPPEAPQAAASKLAPNDTSTARPEHVTAPTARPASATKPRPIETAVPSSDSPFPDPKPPPSFGEDTPPPAPPPKPSASAAPEAPKPALDLPPDPPPPHRGIRAPSDDSELKDPYP
ncbi:MAG TPA: protein kinase [Polyangiaceae bacterium]|nr:protein kinase [Polyangiaceae bacterium]